MIKAVGFLKRKPGMSFDDFMSYYKTKHSKLGDEVMRSVGALRYVRRFIVPAANPFTGDTPESEYDVIVEFWFKDQASLEANFAIATGERREEFERDEENFIDRRATRLVIVVEEDESDL